MAEQKSMILNEYPNIVCALYKECRDILLDNANESGISLFIQNMKTSDITKPDTISKLIVYLAKIINNPKLLSNTFNLLTYKKDIETITTRVNENNGFIDKNKLNESNAADINNALKFILAINNKLSDISISIQLLDINDIDKVKIDASNFIKDFNGCKVSNVCGILNMIEKYKLYNILNIDAEYHELTVLQDMYKVIVDTQIQNTIKFILLYKLFNPFIDESTSYENIIKYATDIYKGNYEFSLLQLNVDITRLHNLGLYTESKDNLFLSILKTYKISDTKVFDDMKIHGKDNLLYSYIDNIFKLELVDVYANKTLDISKLLEVLYKSFLDIFKQIDLLSKLLHAFTITILEKPILNVLHILHKNKEVLLKQVSSDKKTAEEFNKDLQLQFELPEWCGNDLYKDTATDKNILSNICNILNDNDVLNIEYLEKQFKNYTKTIIDILTKFSESQLCIVYEAMISLTGVLKENYTCLMFGDRLLYNELYEDELDVDTSTKLDNHDMSLGDAFVKLVDGAEKHQVSLVKYAEHILNDKNTDEELTSNDSSNNELLSETPPEIKTDGQEVIANAKATI